MICAMSANCENAGLERRVVHARPAVQQDQRRLLAHARAVGDELRAFDVEEEADAVDFDSHAASPVRNSRMTSTVCSGASKNGPWPQFGYALESCEVLRDRARDICHVVDRRHRIVLAAHDERRALDAPRRGGEVAASALGRRRARYHSVNSALTYRPRVVIRILRRAEVERHAVPRVVRTAFRCRSRRSRKCAPHLALLRPPKRSKTATMRATFSARCGAEDDQLAGMLGMARRVRHRDLAAEG